MSFTIARKIGAVLLFPLAGAVAALLTFYSYVNRANANSDFIAIASEQLSLADAVHAYADSVRLGQEDERANLRASIERFDRSLALLNHGGTLAGRPVPAAPSGVSAELLRLNRDWSAVRNPLRRFVDLPAGSSGALAAYESVVPRFPELAAASRLLREAFESRRQADRVQARVTLEAIVVLDTLLLLGGIWFAKRQITRPLQLIEEGTRRVRDGDFGHRIPTVTRDELATLAGSFNKMSGHIGELVTALESERARSQTILESIGDGFFALDRQSRFTFMNPEAERLMGSRATLLGRNIWEAFPDAAGSDFDRKFRQVMQESVSVHFEAFYEGFQSWFEVHAYPSRDGISVYFRDITERKNQEERIRLQGHLLDAVQQAVMAANLQGEITYWNPAAVTLFCWSGADAAGQSLLEIVPPDNDVDRSTLERLIAGETWAGEVRLRDRSGRTFPAILGGSPFSADSGARLGVVIVCTDLTERKHLEAQVLQLQKMEAIGRLAGGVAHDFNNLLTVIGGYAQMIQEQPHSSAAVSLEVGEILKASRRAQALTDRLLAFSRRQVVQRRLLNLNAVVESTENMLRRLIGEDIELNAVLAPDLGAVHADPNQLEQLLMNLVVNARDAMPRGGRLTIETANAEFDPAYLRTHAGVSSGPYVMLAVSDTGHGMDAEVQKHLFEPFFTTKEQGKGTGLGLSTVHGIVKQNNGEIWVYSEPGHGTTFKIYLPRVEAGAEAAEPLESGIRPEQGSETVLLIEDEPALRAMVKLILEQYGYTVLDSANGREGIRTSELYAGPIHLLLTDVVLPEMSGGEAAESLTASRPDLKVLYMSGYTDNSVVHYGPLDPGIAFLQKPFTPEALAKKVRAVLHGELQGRANSKAADA